MGKQHHGRRLHASYPRSRSKATTGVPTRSTSVNAIKSKVRDLTRLLQHSDRLPADVRIEKERALAGYKNDLENALREKQKQQIIGKYHMVRFFDRQKATRNLKKLKRQLAAVPPGDTAYQEIREALHHAEVDVNYTIYHPLTEKYLSLFPRMSKGSASPTSTSGNSVAGNKASSKSPMWSIVEQCMQEGTLDALREGKLSSRYARSVTDVSHGIASDEVRQKQRKQEPRQKVADYQDPSDDGNDSDGGFFEL
ncbi:MAG: hypothetical protein Q9163_001510 [Psora crenata]